MTSAAKPDFTAEELFPLYPKLAARVTNLRTILRNPAQLTRADADLWVEDTRSVIRDFIELNERTAKLVAQQLRNNK